MKGSGYGLFVKPGDISAAEANCNLLDTRDPGSRFARGNFSSFRHNEAANHYIIPRRISIFRHFEQDLYRFSIREYNDENIHDDRPHCQSRNDILFKINLHVTPLF